MKGQAGDRVAFDFALEEIEWELNEENIEEYSEDIDDYGVTCLSFHNLQKFVVIYPYISCSYSSRLKYFPSWSLVSPM